MIAEQEPKPQTPAAPYTLDEERARRWLSRVVAVGDGDWDAEEDEEFGGDFPNIGSDWSPRQEDVTSSVWYCLIHRAWELKILTGPSEPILDVTSDGEAPIYSIGLRLADSAAGLFLYGEVARVPDEHGRDAALAVLRAVVDEANRLAPQLARRRNSDQALSLVRTLAALSCDREITVDGGRSVMQCADAVETLNSLITRARAITAAELAEVPPDTSTLLRGLLRQAGEETGEPEEIDVLRSLRDEVAALLDTWPPEGHKPTKVDVVAQRHPDAGTDIDVFVNGEVAENRADMDVSIVTVDPGWGGQAAAWREEQATAAASVHPGVAEFVRRAFDSADRKYIDDDDEYEG